MLAVVCKLWCVVCGVWQGQHPGRHAVLQQQCGCSASSLMPIAAIDLLVPLCTAF